MPSVEVKRRLFSVRETSIITGRSVPSVWRDIAEGRLESVLICGSRKVKGESIDRMCADGSPAPKPGRPRKAAPSTPEAIERRAAAILRRPKHAEAEAADRVSAREA